MKLRWPFVRRSTHTRVVNDISTKYAHDMERAQAEASADRTRDLRDCARAIKDAVMRERVRCAHVTKNAPKAARAVTVKEQILAGILSGPEPRWSHPDLPSEPDANSTAASTTATFG